MGEPSETEGVPSEQHEGVPPEIVAALRSVCLGLPEAYEQEAWVGTRWRVRTRTFAHVVRVEPTWPPVYARVVRADHPVIVVTFRSAGEELEALDRAGHPFFVARWGRDVVGMTLDAGVDWDEVAELLTESYCLLAPGKLVDLVNRPPG